MIVEFAVGVEVAAGEVVVVVVVVRDSLPVLGVYDSVCSETAWRWSAL